MPTRKELLENLNREMERLTDAEQNNTDALQRYGEGQIQASDNIKKAGRDIAGGLIVSSVISLVSGVVSKGIEQFVERVKEINRKTELINSIIKLQEIHQYLTYRFVIERSYASNTTNEERQTILNGLISDGIVTQYKYNKNIKALRIDEDNPELLAYWEWLDEARNKLQRNSNTNDAVDDQDNSEEEDNDEDYDDYEEEDD